jgi:3-dehydroquinate dehydratase-2
MRVLILNGPNLNLTGIREPSIYGSTTFDDYLSELRAAFANHQIDYYQSNHEGDLIDKLHTEGFSADGIVLNAGAYTHTSLALADAVAAIKTPVIEVHMSNVAAREPIRHQSLTAANGRGFIAGFGLESYSLAILHFINQA